MKNTFVNTYFASQMTNSEKIKNTLKFDPDRWDLPEIEGMKSSFEFIPFSAGARNCVG